jgi:hypothetical protein
MGKAKRRHGDGANGLFHPRADNSDAFADFVLDD